MATMTTLPEIDQALAQALGECGALVECPRCEGQGGYDVDGRSWIECPACDATGMVEPGVDLDAPLPPHDTMEEAHGER